MTQARLRTARLDLVPLGPEHLEQCVELDSDPEVLRYICGRARTRAEVEARHAVWVATAEQVDGLGFWAGFERGSSDGPASDGFVGWWILEAPSRPDQGPAAGQAELGYRILRRHWRRGIASEGARELVRHAFEDLGLERVLAETMAVNLGSRAVMAAIGMRRTRSFHEGFDEVLEGAEEGEVEYAVTRTEWSAAATGPARVNASRDGPSPMP